MSILKKFKKYGFIGSLKKAGNKIISIINNSVYYFCSIFPINNNLIVLESEGDLCDNAFALYEYMKSNNYLEKYKVVWLVNDVKKAQLNKWPNTVFVDKWGESVDIKRSYYLATCRHYIYDHCNVLNGLKKREETVITNLWHGCGFKGKKDGLKNNIYDNFDNIFVTGKLHFQTHMLAFNCNEEKIIDIGYPRNDYFFKDINDNQVKFEREFNLQKYDKIFLWMPTFRKSINSAISEEYFNSRTGLPLVEDEKKLEKFNEFLKQHNAFCLFKVHHLQAKLDVFKNNYSNFMILKDEDIFSRNLQLYQIVSFADCLISDYSSIVNDFMLLDRPIIYTLDDYDEYIKSRGFIIEDPIKYFIGDHVINIEELYNAMLDVINNNDKYITDRKNLIDIMHTYNDGYTSKRIVEFLGL